MDDETKSFVIGMLLGDANINKRGNNYRLFIKHGGSQIFYSKWKRNLLSAITGMNVNIFKQKVKGKEYIFGQFVTLTHPEFDSLYHLFYRSNKKIVPVEIKDLLNEKVLSTWIMDDGAKASKGMTIQTHSFSEEEVERLIDAIKSKFNLLFTKRINKSHHIIYIPKVQVRSTWNLVKNYILPEFRYKFPLTP